MGIHLFISHRADDHIYGARIMTWAKAGELGDSVVIFQGVRRDNVAVSDDELERRLGGVQVLALLIGDDDETDSFAEREAEFATSHDIRVVPMRLPGTLGSPPSSLRGRSLLRFAPQSLDSAISQVSEAAKAAG